MLENRVYCSRGITQAVLEVSNSLLTIMNYMITMAPIPRYLERWHAVHKVWTRKVSCENRQRTRQLDKTARGKYVLPQRSTA